MLLASPVVIGRPLRCLHCACFQSLDTLWHRACNRGIHPYLAVALVQITVARSSGLTTTINKSAELVDALKRGIDLQENARLGDESAKKESKAWERDVKSRVGCLLWTPHRLPDA